MSVDLKTLTPDGSLPTTGFVFGADSQASASPSVYTMAAVATTVGLQFPAGAQATPSISTTGDNDTGIWFPAANTVAASTGGLERMRITSTGLVGINTTSPGERFHVFSGGAEFAIQWDSTGSKSWVLASATNRAYIRNKTDSIEAISIYNGGNVTIAAGNVGVGTVNPTARLNVVDSTSQDAVRITQTGAGNALVVEDSANPDSTPFVIDANGIVVVGNTTGVPAYGFNNQFSVVSALNSYQLNAAFRNDAFSPILTIAHSRGTTVNAHAVVQNNDDTGILAFAGSDGTQFIRTAQVSSAVDGVPGLNDMPGRLVFSTTADGASTPLERMRIDNQGRVGINSTGNSFHRLVVVENTNNNATALFTAASDTAAPSLTQSRTRASGTSVVSGDSIGTLEFQGWDGSSGSGRVLAIATVDGATSTGSVPTRLTFWTTPSGSLLPLERFRIASDGKVGVSTTSFSANARFQVTTSIQYQGYVLNNGTNDAARIIGFGATNDEGGIQLLSGGVERVRILSTSTSYFNGGDVGIGTSSPQARLDVAGRIWSTPPAGGLAGMTMYTAAASGFAPGQIAFTRASATGGATPNNSAVGEFRFEGRDANGSYTSFASISAEMFTNAAGGAPGSMSFLISASGASAQERMRLTSQGLGVGSTSFGTSAERVLSIGTGVAPTTGPADTIQIYSTDLSAGNTILSLFTEGTPVNANTTADATHRIAVRINGTVYYLLANTAA